MTFYNYIENVRYEMFKLINDWTYEGAETKARISENLDQARNEYNQLRELANLAAEYISYDRCEGCVTKTACSNHKLDECWMVTKLHNQLRELRIEVDDGREA